MMRGVVYSECLTPIEKRGAAGLVMVTFSGLCVPGPGFLVESNSNSIEWENVTVKPLLKDPLRKGQCINCLYTKDILK